MTKPKIIAMEMPISKLSPKNASNPTIHSTSGYTQSHNYNENHCNSTTQSPSENRKLNDWGIAQLPDTFSLTPVKDKKPYRDGWQSETSLTHSQLLKELDGYATGYGLRLGDVSGGLIALDIDGASVQELLNKIGGDIPETISWTSGKEGRYQLLFQVPDEYRERLEKFGRKSFKEWNGYQCESGEQLELRYNNHQSVLPPSKHPDTGQYEWLMNPQDTEVAIAPEWLLKLAIDELTDPANIRTPKPSQTKPPRTKPSKTKPQKQSRWEQHLDKFPYPDEIPLEKCLSKENQELLINGVGEGSRNTKASSIAYDAVATARFLESEGQPYSGTVEDIIADFCERCTPTLSAKECRAITKSAISKGRDSERTEYIPSIVASYFWIPEVDNAGGNVDDVDDVDEKPKKLSTAKLITFVEQNYQLAYNEITRELEVDGKVLNTEPYLLLARDHNIEAGKDKTLDIFTLIAKENTYNPVREYLDKISAIATPTDISQLATRFFGTSNPLYDKFVEKMLIGAVARVYEPGCKCDTALVLQGNQGIGKSTFFDVLGGDYFDDSMGSGSDKDDLLTLHRSWIQEWGELDRILGKRHAGEVKDFLSKRLDNFREPYARKTQTFYRHSIIVGSVNDAQFLNDPTGDRRFWVIPVENKEIDIEQLKRDRDSIWAAAVKAYKEGKSWWLTKQEQLESTANNDRFQIRDEWEMIIQDYLENRDRTTVSELLSEALGFENTKDMDRSSQARVTTALKSLGWVKNRETYKGKRQMVWKDGTGGTGQGGGHSTCAKPETPIKSDDGTGGTGGTGNLQTLSNNLDKGSSSKVEKVSEEGMSSMSSVPNSQTEGDAEVAQVDNGGEPPMPSVPKVEDLAIGDVVTVERLLGGQAEAKVIDIKEGKKNTLIKYQLDGQEGITYPKDSNLIAIADQWGNIKWKKQGV